MEYFLFRKATLMEDEGRETFVRRFDTEKEVKEWIKAQEGQYFSPYDYYYRTFEPSKGP